MADSAIVQFYQEIFTDLSIDSEEATRLNEFLTVLNPPPDKLTKLRATAFKIGCNYLSDDTDNNLTLLRTINYVVHAIEQNCMEPKDESVSAIDYDEDTLSEFYKSLFDDLSVDYEESQSLYEYYQNNQYKIDDLVQVRALVFKIGSEYLNDDKESNVQLLRCINVIVHAFEMSFYQPKPFQMHESDDSIDYSNMSLQDAVQHLWDLDVNRLTPGDDYTINVQKGKKPFWKEDSAPDPLFTYVDNTVWQRPTYKSFMALLDNYTAETGSTETITDTERAEITTFLNAIMQTKPMQFCHQYCNTKIPNKVSSDQNSFIQLLRTIWFDLYTRQRGSRPDSSGFEHVFVGEIKNGEISGFHNWIQFYIEEKKGALDYRGYIKPKSNDNALHDDNDYILTLQFTWNNIEKFVGGGFIGVSPEFEFALYTMCFLLGQEENHIELCTGTDTFNIIIKCYTMDNNKIGTAFPEITSHFEE